MFTVEFLWAENKSNMLETGALATDPQAFANPALGPHHSPLIIHMKENSRL